jgi:hypothetical protein
MADKTLPLDATGQLQLKLIDNGDGTYSISAAQQSSRMVGLATGGSVSTLVDTSINIPDDILIGKIIRMFIDGVEFVRTITDNTADTITFADLVAKVAAQAVIENAGGGKVTITAVPEGAYANDYKVVVQQGEGASAETVASFADGVLTIILGTDAGTAASVQFGSGDDGVLTITRKEVGDTDLFVSIAVSLGESSPMTVQWLGDSIGITLGTDEETAPDANKNTVALIAAAINDHSQLGELFTAAFSGEGTGVLDADDETVQTDFAGGVDPAINATAAEVAAAINTLDNFSAAETTSGVLAALEEPVAFSGGVDEVKTVPGTQYYIVRELIES